MKTKTSLLAALCLLASVLCPLAARAQKRPELAPTPPMGWNSWDWFGPKITEPEVVAIIDAMVATGLRDAGYNTIVVDGGWREDFLDANGALIPSADRFPKGIKWLAEYAHSKGFKFGLHVVPGCCDCRGNEMGSYGHEATHLKQYLDWKLDFIKLDQCRLTNDKGGGWTPAKVRDLYTKWSKLLRDCGRDITLSASNYFYHDWYPELTNMGRTTGDIRCRWTKTAIFDDSQKPKSSAKEAHSVMEIADFNNDCAKHAGNGYWNDPDMLPLGNQGLTDEEQKILFSLWCIMSAPLFLGNDPSHMTPQELALISNKELIAVNQDPAGQGIRISSEKGVEVWQKKLTNGDRALLILNRKTTPGQTTVNFKKLGLPKTLRVRDLYNKKDLGQMEELNAQFPARGSMCVRVSQNQ